ncbi:MAG: hypothetical protein MUF23_09200 [Pirellula sp.]|jgi:hypothetical protein|nr:hypothetical protein [Pirellula sp.]
MAKELGNTVKSARYQIPNENGGDRASLPSGPKLSCDLTLPRTDGTIA